MGVSTDAILLYGVPLSSDTDLSYDEESGVESGPAWMNWMGNADSGVTIVEHCSDACPMYFVAIEATVVRAWRGHPKYIIPMKLDVAVANVLNEHLAAFCKKYGLKPDGNHGWYLASYWG